MKALSLFQPIASLTMLRAPSGRIAKMFETRSWRTHFRGEVAIHATAASPLKYRLLFMVDPFKLVMQHNKIARLDWLPAGKIIGVVDLIDCMPVAEALKHPKMTAMEKEFGDYSAGRFAWLFANPRPLHTLIPFKGHQGFWTLPPAESEIVNRQLLIVNQPCLSVPPGLVDSAAFTAEKSSSRVLETVAKKLKGASK